MVNNFINNPSFGPWRISTSTDWFQETTNLEKAKEWYNLKIAFDNLRWNYSEFNKWKAKPKKKVNLIWKK